MELKTTTWAEQQWGQCKLGDPRLTRRAVRIGQRIAERPEASLVRQMGDGAELRGAYRLLNNARVTFEQLCQPHFEQTRAQARRVPVVLFIQDWTTLDYSHHPATTGMGPVGSRRQRGMLLQSVLAVRPEARQVLGLAHAQVLIRPEAPPTRPPPGQRRQSAEGQAWEVAVRAVGAAPEGVTWVHVSDRESDIYEYLQACRAWGKHFVVRAYHNRALAAETLAAAAPRLLPTVQAWEALSAHPAYTVEVPARKNQPKRQAVIALHWGTLTLRSPKSVQPPSTLTVNVIRAWEPDPPPGVEPIEWILLTSWPVTCWAEARQVVEWYECRWLIEDYHQCLKTGCRIEVSQLDHALDLQRLLGFAAPIAVRLLQLRQVARTAPNQLAATTIEPLLLQLLAHHLQRAPTELTLAQFWQEVARLGGYLGRSRDGPPGWRAVWKGWRLLSDWAEGARLALP